MRLFLPIFLLIATNALFAQDSATIKEINALVEPKFHFDTSNNNFGDAVYSIDTINANTIIKTWKLEGDSLSNFSKIFVFKSTNGKLTIIDSSATYGRDGKGPNLWVIRDTLLLDHSCHDCTNQNTYLFDRTRQKYRLISLQYSEVIRSYKSPYVGAPIGVLEEFYDVAKQQLRIEKRDDYESKIKFRKIIKKPWPKDFIPDLAHYVDLVGKDLRYSDFKGNE